MGPDPPAAFRIFVFWEDFRKMSVCDFLRWDVGSGSFEVDRKWLWVTNYQFSVHADSCSCFALLFDWVLFSGVLLLEVSRVLRKCPDGTGTL